MGFLADLLGRKKAFIIGEVGKTEREQETIEFV
jgi:hypothetical protein